MKLGEVAINSTAATKDHEADGYARYIIGKHIPEEGGRVTSWNPVGDAEFGSRIRTIVRAGDVICTTRGPKLKVAVAEFDCLSAHTNFILRPKDARRLLPGILEAIIRSDAFQDHLRKHFRGSTNLFVNWSDAAEYEFALPPLEEQQRVAKLLLSLDDTTSRFNGLASAASKLRQSVYVHQILAIEGADWMTGQLSADTFPPDWQLQPAAELCVDLITKGATPQGALSASNTGIPFFKVYNLTFDGRLDFSVAPTWISEAGHRELRRSAVHPGDVLMNIVGPPLGKVSRVPTGMPTGNINQAIARFRAPSDELGVWLEAYLLSPVAQAWLALRSKKTSGQRNLTLETCRELPVPIPPDLGQRLAALETVRRAEAQAASRLATLHLQSRLASRSAFNSVKEPDDA